MDDCGLHECFPGAAEFREDSHGNLRTKEKALNVRLFLYRASLAILDDLCGYGE